MHRKITLLERLGFACASARRRSRKSPANPIFRISPMACLTAFMVLGWGQPAQSQEPDWCRPAHEAVKRVDKNCLCAASLSDRVKKLNEFFELEQTLDVLDCAPDAEAWFCGGLLDDDQTYVAVSPIAATADVGDTVQLTAGVYGTKCNDIGPPCKCQITAADQEFEHQVVGWQSENPDVAVVDQNGLVTVVGPGVAQITVVAEIEGHPNSPLITNATITVGAHRAVDIGLVMESGDATYDYVGLALWNCNEDACVGWGGDTWSDSASFWGLCGSPGEQLVGNFQAEDSNVLAISLDEDGPFVAGPLSITFTCGDGAIARTDKLWFKAIAEGATTVDYCIGETCDPLLYDPDRARFGWWGEGISVGTAVQYPVDPPGLKQIGSEVASLLENNFNDPRFAATAFGAYPEFAVGCSGYEGQDWYLDDFKPYWDTAPYVDFLSFTSDPSAIAGALGEIRLICSDPIPVYDPVIGGKSVYSATIHAINEFAWRPDAALRALIVFSVNPACYEVPDDPPYCDIEKGSGYTRQDVIDAALAANVRLIMINAGWGSYEERMRGPFQEIALQTDGWYTEDYLDFWPMLTVFETSFEWIWKESIYIRK